MTVLRSRFGGPPRRTAPDPNPFPTMEVFAMNSEPIAIINALAGLFVLIVGGLAHAFGWSDDAVELIVAIVGGASVFAATLFARAKVDSPETVTAKVADAKRAAIVATHPEA